MLTTRLGSLALLFCIQLSLVSTDLAAEGLHIEKADGKLVITNDGKLVTNYYYSDKAPKPYFFPVNIPGTEISFVRPLQEPDADGKYPKSYDHKHHRGIWIGVEKVKELDHWMEKHPTVNKDIAIEKTTGDSVSFTSSNEWQDEQGQPVLLESTGYTIHANGLWTVEITLTPVEDKVMIGDTKEGFLGIRMDDDLRGDAGGLIINADGLKGEKGAWGKSSAWVDYTGERNGQRIGVALFDDPANFREGLYHVRNYGLFSISPFGPSSYSNAKEPEQPVILSKKTPLKLRYGIYIHSGTAEEAKVAETYQQFLSK
jgi:hypothetical protein